MSIIRFRSAAWSSSLSEPISPREEIPYSAMRSLVAWVLPGGSVLTKPRSATVCITPPFAASARSCSSSMFRETSASALVPECDAMTGAAESSAACSMASFEMWETSTRMPSRFISAITSLPNSLIPPCSASASPSSSRGLQESAMSLCPLWARVM